MNPSVKSLKFPATLPLAAALAACATFAMPAHATGTVTVNWVEPEHYVDAGRSPMERERTLKTLTEYVQGLARRLPDGQALTIDVLDLDLAGEPRPAHGQEVRVLSGRADWPHMSLRYTLSQGDQTLKSGEARLADMNYLQGLPGREASEGSLPYERHMLRQWFEATFPPTRP